MRHRREATSHTQAITLALALTLLVLLALWKLPALQVTHIPGTTAQNRFDREDGARKTLAQILGGVFLLGGLYMSFKTFALSREGQITDRFTKAIEQLGWVNGPNPSIEVRLGAIYALERIALDSPRDHWTIMEVLTAYIRQNAPLDPTLPYSKGDKPRTDIQAILTVLGRRPTGPPRERPDQHLDLTKSRLNGANLIAATLQGARFTGASLQGATFHQASLRAIDFDQADLRDAFFLDADLHDALCVDADLRQAILTNANLQGAFLWKTHLDAADLTQADLRNASLDEATLQDAILLGTKLQDAKSLDVEQIQSARSWEHAHYSPGLRDELGLPPVP